MGMIIVLTPSQFTMWIKYSHQCKSFLQKMKCHVDIDMIGISLDVATWGLGWSLPSFCGVETPHLMPQESWRENQSNHILGTLVNQIQRKRKIAPWEGFAHSSKGDWMDLQLLECLFFPTYKQRWTCGLDELVLHIANSTLPRTEALNTIIISFHSHFSQS